MYAPYARVQEHKAKHDQLLAHLAAPAGTRAPRTRSPNYASAGKGAKKDYVKKGDLVGV